MVRERPAALVLKLVELLPSYGLQERANRFVGAVRLQALQDPDVDDVYRVLVSRKVEVLDECARPCEKSLIAVFDRALDAREEEILVRQESPGVHAVLP